MMESLRKLTRPDVILLVTEALAGAPFLGRLASTFTKHPELTGPYLCCYLSSLIVPWFTHAISVIKACLPALQDQDQGTLWPKASPYVCVTSWDVTLIHSRTKEMQYAAHPRCENLCMGSFRPFLGGFLLCVLLICTGVTGADAILH